MHRKFLTKVYLEQEEDPKSLMKIYLFLIW